MFLNNLNCEDINCVFGFTPNNNYACVIRSVIETPTEATSVSGDHKEHKNASDVTVLIAAILKTKFYPTKICTQLNGLLYIRLVAPEVTELARETFFGCSEVKSIQIIRIRAKTLDEDLLADVPSLKQFQLIANDLEVLPKNLFKHNTALKNVAMIFNRLKIVDTDFPEGLKKLSFFGNICNKGRINPASNLLNETLSGIKKECSSSSYML